MRFLGFLFLLLLIAAVVGAFRGWFTVTTTTHAGETKDVTLGVHTDRMREDAAKLAEVPEKVAAQVRSIGKKVNADETEVEGSVVSADAITRRLVVRSGVESLELDVGSSVRIERAGTSESFDRLHAGTNVRLRFRHDGDARKLARIEILGER
jgi:hypothetical protein